MTVRKMLFWGGKNNLIDEKGDIAQVFRNGVLVTKEPETKSA